MLIVRFVTTRILLSTVIFFGMGMLGFLSLPAHASSSDVVINELMYNPQSDNQNEEYLELYNKSGSPIDVSNWCFTVGITGCFASGTIIGGNDYLVVSPNALQTQTTYGLTVDLVYTGNLSNGGETITLVDDGAVQVDSITYDDVSPWPSSPDGDGPSLELNDPAQDNSLANSWGASLSPGGTPGVQNSIFGVSLPEISNVSKHTIVQPSATVTVTAHVQGSVDVDLLYKVMFDSEVSVEMYDDGSHGDGQANDGIYGAQIPAQEAGKLVRYRVTATNLDGVATSPSNNESVNYYPYIIDDGQDSNLPIVRWYMDVDDFTDMTTNHLTDDQKFPAVVAVDDQIFDNAQVRVKGQSSVVFPKRKYKFDLPSGVYLQSPIFDHPVDEFAIQVYFLNLSDIQEAMSWKAFDDFGFVGLQNRYVRAQRNSAVANSAFIGHYLLIENYDNLWRQRNNRESGAMYKQGNDKKTRTNEDNSDIQSLINNITTLQGQELKDYLLDNLNIPAIVNYNAVSASISHDDWTFWHNIFQYRDTEGTGRWEYMPWDLDNAFLVSVLDGMPNGADYLKYPVTGELKKQISGEDSYYDDALIERAIYQFPEFRQMFFRRSMNVYDQIWGNDRYKDWYNGYFNSSHDTLSDDFILWNPYRKQVFESVFPGGLPWTVPDDFPLGGYNSENYFDYLDSQTPEDGRTLYFYGANRMKAKVASYRANGELLPPQTTDEERHIQITEINYNPSGANQALEFLELYNASDKPIDISNWQIEGLGFTFPAGSVIPSHQYGVIVRNDTTFRAEYPSVLVLGQYSQDLPNNGESLRLLNASGNVVLAIDYGISGNWPESANGGGFTLGLLRAGANESQSACWAPSSQPGGTPGSVNDLDAGWVSNYGAGCADKASTAGRGGGNDAEEENLARTGANSSPVIRNMFLLLVIGVTGYFVYAKIKLKRNEGDEYNK